MDTHLSYYQLLYTDGISAFIAASRRKDRSLDARLESANRASVLHKKRTGKCLHITKDIVEKEAMYEEVDERYQEKRIRMLQAQNMQIEDQLNRQLLAALAVRANSNNHRGSSSPSSSSPAAASLSSASARSSSASSAAPSIVAKQQPRRASSMTPRGPMDGVRKMSLDLSSLRSSMSEGMQTGPMTSPMVMNQGYMMSPGYETFPSPEQNSQSEWYSPQVSPYLQQTQWAQQRTGFQPQPQQQHIIQQDSMPEMATNYRMRPFRDRFASAPDISLHGLPINSFSMMSPGPVTAPALPQQQPQHTRVRSEPDVSMMMQPPFQPPFQQPVSKPASPKTHFIPNTYPSPNTPPRSPKSTALEPEQVPISVAGPAPTPQPGMMEEGLDTSAIEGGMLFSHNALDPEFDDFSRFALDLGNGTELSERDGLRFDDFLALDDFTAAA